MQQHRSSPRLHRFPHRIDYTLIPAPLDLTLPMKAESDSLPAIIVTPSSPSSARDFSIAFLAPPPKPTLRQRLPALSLPSPKLNFNFNFALNFRLRTFLVLFFVLFLFICHMVAHRLAARRPHIEFSVQSQSHSDAHLVTEGASFGSWFVRSIWGEDEHPRALGKTIPTGNAPSLSSL